MFFEVYLFFFCFFLVFGGKIQKFPKKKSERGVVCGPAVILLSDWLRVQPEGL